MADALTDFVLRAMPLRFVFIPHGWWHALRPLDDVTVITGPSKLSHHYHTEEAGTT